MKFGENVTSDERGKVRKLIVLFIFFYLAFFPLSAQFFPFDYLTEKGYEYKIGRYGKESYKNGLNISISPFSRIFKINDYAYFLNFEPISGARGVELSSKDEVYFKEVVEFYENKFYGKMGLPNQITSLKKKNEKLEKVDSSKPESPAGKLNPKLNPKLTHKLTPIFSGKKIREGQGKEKINYIFIDAGHGGKDPGAIFYGYKEKTMALNIALELAKRLNEQLAGTDTKVVLTRKSDEYISLEDRCKIANETLKENENGLFVSVHLNIWINPLSRGFEVYYLSHDDEINQERVQTHLEDIGVNQSDYFKKIFSYLEIGQYQRESFLLANNISESIVKNIKNYPIRDRSKSDIFYVLRGVLMPSVLLEMGFISNREDVEFLNNEEKRGQLLNLVATSILDYVGDFERSNGFKEGLFIEKTLK